MDNIENRSLGEQLRSLPAEYFPYEPVRFLETDSRMSHLLLALTADGSEVIIKLGCTAPPSRSALNQQAISNEGAWLNLFRGQPGIVQLWDGCSEAAAEGPPTANDAPASVACQLPIADKPNYIALGYLPGGTLTSFVGNNRLRIETALRIAYYVARSLAMLHEHRCVHRDLKPENILFERVPSSQADIDTYLPTLIDFGVAAQAGTKRMVSGSRQWMAPELQAAYENRGVTVEPSSDVYALGLMLCYMLTGRKPRRRHYDVASYAAYVDRAIATLEQDAENGSFRELLEPAIALIRSTVAEDKHERPTAAAFVATAAHLLGKAGRPIPERPDLAASNRWVTNKPTPSAPSKRFRGWALRGVAAAALVALVLLASSLLWQKPDAAEPKSVSDNFASSERDESPASRETQPALMQPTLMPPPEGATQVAKERDVTLADGSQGSDNLAPTLIPVEKITTLPRSAAELERELHSSGVLPNIKLTAEWISNPVTDSSEDQEPHLRFSWDTLDAPEPGYCLAILLWQTGGQVPVATYRPAELMNEVLVPQAEIQVENLQGWSIQAADCNQPEMILGPMTDVQVIPEFDDGRFLD